MRLYKIFLNLFLTLSTSVFVLHAKPKDRLPKKPRLIIPIVIDQGAALLFKKILPHVSQGLYKINSKGFSFEKAYHPHACPNTAAGHSALSTGAYPDTHGIVDNKFFNEDGKIQESDDDNRETSFVYTPEGSVYSYGKSSCNMKADTLIDQTMLHSEPTLPWKAASFAIKSRAAIMMAGHQGKAFWMDPAKGSLTTSKAYCKKLPQWVKNFNNINQLNDKSTYFWRPFLSLKSDGYKKKEIDNYDFSSIPSVFNQTIAPDFSNKEPFDLFTKAPWGITWTFDAAAQYIENTFKKNKDAQLLAWISISTIDRAGHMWGPSSAEVIDLMYYFDAELLRFMNRVYAHLPADEVLFVITSDHGIFEIPEVLNKKGFPLPERILSGRMMESMNNLIEKIYGIQNFYIKFDAPYFFADQALLTKQNPEKIKKIYKTTTDFLKKIPGIRIAWTTEELLEKSPPKNSFEYRFKRQIYPGRNGQIVILTQPYVMITNYPKGTSHATPYWYDVHVPLMFYQKKRWNGQKQLSPVMTLSVAATLAQIMDIDLPSTAEPEVLPGLF